MATLKFKTKEEIPADLQASAEEIKEGDEKGQWSVKVAPSAKVDEFRDRNVEQARKLEAAEKDAKTLRQVLGLKDDAQLDADAISTELTELRETKKKVDDGKLSKSEDIEKELEKRTAKMRSEHEDKVAALTKANNELKTQNGDLDTKFKRTFIDREAFQVCTDTDLGVEGWAMKYIVEEAYKLYHVDDNGKLTPKRDGSVVYGESGTDPMTIKEWVDTELRKSSPQFFKKSGGGGATGGNGDASKFGGFSESDFNKLPPEKRLAIANEQAAKKQVRR
jgi:hypothetical protein